MYFDSRKQCVSVPESRFSIATVRPNATQCLVGVGFSGLRPHLQFRLGKVRLCTEARLERNEIMKKKISVYWPLAIVVPLAAVAYLHLYNQTAVQLSQSPLAAERVSAELARTVSYGFVGGEASMPVKTLSTATRMPAQPL
jgi:hypothetical protein